MAKKCSRLSGTRDDYCGSNGTENSSFFMLRFRHRHIHREREEYDVVQIRLFIWDEVCYIHHHHHHQQTNNIDYYRYRSRRIEY